jgi:hypothetical protein
VDWPLRCALADLTQGEFGVLLARLISRKAREQNILREIEPHAREPFWHIIHPCVLVYYLLVGTLMDDLQVSPAGIPKERSVVHGIEV